MARNLLGKVREKMRYGTVLYYVQGRLSRAGLVFNPYYLVKERLVPESDLKVSLQPKLPCLSVSFLDEDEIAAVYEHPERDASKQSYRIPDRLAGGCRCFGVKHERQVVAYTWCDYSQCNHRPLTFPLKEDEAYLFDMYTFKRYRGRNIAPYMRYQLYRRLTEMGRTTYYSITDAWNTPSAKFKRKLGAEPEKLYLNIKLFGRLEWNVLVK